MRTRTTLAAATVLAAGALLGWPAAPAADKLAPVTDDDAAEIAVEAYLYACPLVIMDVTRQVTTPDPQAPLVGSAFGKGARWQGWRTTSGRDVMYCGIVL
jgi:hypothetical protein